MFLKQLREEILNEDSKIGQLPKKFSDFLLYLRASEPVTYELLKNYTDYYWMSDKPGKEATMGVAMYGGRLQFYIGKTFYSKLTFSQLAFLMYHELAHYKRGHCNSNFNLGKSNHDLANICEDIYINEDANRDGEFAGIPIKFVKGVLMKKTGTYKGTTSQGIDIIAEKSFNNLKVKESEYLSINSSADLYRYLMTESKKQNKEQQQQQQQQQQQGDPQQGSSGPGKKITPKKGDVVRGPNGQYGRVTKTIGGKVKEIEPLDKKQAEDIAKNGKLFIKPLINKQTNNIFAPKKPIDIA